MGVGNYTDSFYFTVVHYCYIINLVFTCLDYNIIFSLFKGSLLCVNFFRGWHEVDNIKTGNVVFYKCQYLIKGDKSWS